MTQKDIATRLGISVSTVSRALKGNPNIHDKTREAVLALAKEGNYQPNSNALSLKKRRSFRIGVIIPEIVHHFFSSVISGIMEYAEQNGYSVLLTQSNESYQQEMREAQLLFSTQVDGLLVSLSNETSSCNHFIQFQDYGIPVVFFDKTKNDFEASTVVVDDRVGAFGATQHLIDVGCKRIAHIKGPRRPLNAKRRLQGYLEALESNGLPVDEDLILECTDVSRQEGYDFTKRFLSLKKPPDGIFTITDKVGVGAMDAIREAELEVPKDVAVVGFSDSEVATVVRPHLSSVRQPGFEIGAKATELLLQEIDIYGEDEVPLFQNIVLDTSLQIRESSRRTNF